MKKCVLCGEEIEGRGHDPQPLALGQCCDACNIRVMAARLRDHRLDELHKKVYGD
tara:strand:- start:246 stop:410 length:165 start_codon:yes stop_codon:yes gene_type:complete